VIPSDRSALNVLERNRPSSSPSLQEWPLLPRQRWSACAPTTRCLDLSGRILRRQRMLRRRARVGPEEGRGREPREEEGRRPREASGLQGGREGRVQRVRRIWKGGIRLVSWRWRIVSFSAFLLLVGSLAFDLEERRNRSRNLSRIRRRACLSLELEPRLAFVSEGIRG